MATSTKKQPETVRQERVLKFRNFQIYWDSGINLEMGEIPEGATIEVHPTFVVIRRPAPDWDLILPMDRVEWVNVQDQVE